MAVTSPALGSGDHDWRRRRLAADSRWIKSCRRFCSRRRQWRSSSLSTDSSAYTFFVSLTNWKSAKPDMTIHQPVGAIYPDLFSQTRFQIDIRNTVVFTDCFSDHGGAGWVGPRDPAGSAYRGSGFFRSVFLFPYALSFITTGVAWRWIFNPETGINLLIDATGLTAAGRKWIWPTQTGLDHRSSRRLATQRADCGGLSTGRRMESQARCSRWP